MKRSAAWKAVRGLISLLLIVFMGAGAEAGGDGNALGAGRTQITILIETSLYGHMTEYAVYTDAATLRDALLGVGLISGERAPWGYYVTTVNGRKADYDYKGEYWQVYFLDSAGGRSPLASGIENTRVKTGDTFLFSLENPSGPVAAALAVEALTIDNLSTRSGPSTEYRDTGTYNVKGEYVEVFTLSYDKNGVCWVQCDIPYGSRLRRLYTGLKRFDAASFHLADVPEEEPLGYRVQALSTSRAMYGPGGQYAAYDSLTVDKGQIVTVIALENGYAQVEWITPVQSYRAWVPAVTLGY